MGYFRQRLRVHDLHGRHHRRHDDHDHRHDLHGDRDHHIHHCDLHGGGHRDHHHGHYRANMVPRDFFHHRPWILGLIDALNHHHWNGHRNHFGHYLCTTSF